MAGEAVDCERSTSPAASSRAALRADFRGADHQLGGATYTNTDENWTWLQAVASKARWLGYINFSDISDERNAAPIIRTVDSTVKPAIAVDHNAHAVVPVKFDECFPRRRSRHTSSQGKPIGSC